MAIIDVVKYGGGPDDLVWKFPTDQIVWGSQLIVNESQEAVFFKGGQALDVFGPGTYTLKTGNIPLLEKLVNMPFGGDTPFSAEVWFVNKRTFNQQRWGTKTPIQVQDPKYGLFIPVRAFGQYGFKVTNSQFFVTELVGTQHKTTTEEIAGYLRGVITSKLSDMIAEMMAAGSINVVTLNTQLEEIGSAVRGKLSEAFAKYGMELGDFIVESINVPEDDPAVQKLKTALADKAEMDILGDKYQQKRMLDIGEKAAQNEGGAAGSGMGAGLGMGMGMNMANMMSGQMAGQPAQGAAPAAEDPASKLQKLKTMLDQGLITEDDFNAKKQQILESM